MENFISNDKKTYIICEKRIYFAVEDYLLSFYKKINSEIIIYDKIKDICIITPLQLYIFIQTIPSEILLKIKNIYVNNIYLLNIEQLSRVKENQIIHTFPNCIKILDYSRANMKYYNGKYNVSYLPYQINYEEIYNLPKEMDICIMAVESPRRRNIINNFIKKGININIISGWKKERDDKLFQHKILINIGYDPSYKIFESIRCDRCIFNKMIVISEQKENIDLYGLKDYMIFEDYNKIVDKAIKVLNNYEFYYKKLGLDILNLDTLKIC